MKKILIISNDRPLLQTLNNQLKAFGFAMEKMEAQEDMLNLIKAKKPDALLVDFIWGDTNAAAVCHQVTSDPDLYHLPVIIFSNMPGIKQLAAKLGVFNVIKKPANIVENVIAALREQKRSA